MYKSEQEFSSHIVSALRQYGYMVQRLESPETGRGIPDLWCCNKHGKDYWIELKNSRLSVAPEHNLSVPWRAGQQAWALEYRRHMKRCTFTVMSVRNGYVVIPMCEVFRHNIVLPEQYRLFTTIHDVMLCID